MSISCANNFHEAINKTSNTKMDFMLMAIFKD